MSCPSSPQSSFRIRLLYFSFKDTVGAELNFFTNSFLSSAAFSDIDGSPFGPRIPCSARAGTVNKTSSNNERSSGRCPTNIFIYALFLDGKVGSESLYRVTDYERDSDPTFPSILPCDDRGLVLLIRLPIVLMPNRSDRLYWADGLNWLNGLDGFNAGDLWDLLNPSRLLSQMPCHFVL